MSPVTRAVRLSALALALGVPAVAQAQAPALHAASGPPWPEEVSAPSSRRVKFTSAVNGESYTLFVRVPVTPPPPGGYPVLYVLDGDFFFGTAADAALAIGDPAHTPLVVGIGHGLFDDMDVVARYARRPPGVTGPIGLGDIGGANNALRFHDYTLPVAPEHRAPAWTGLTPPDVGGVDQFLKVIETEIKPKVAALAPVDAGNQALFGHSVGGLAVLRALFTEPGAFRTFIAASPSIWWDADAVLKDEKAFAGTVESSRASPRVLICVGADEPDSPNPPQAMIDSLPAQMRSELGDYLKMASRWSGMISGAHALSDRLGQLHGEASYKVQFIAFAGEGHSTVPFAALSRAVQFAFMQ
jgi:predicted alpha/beta superfamily hydrolase